jgi:uncharacterized protein (TIGR00251 family)
VVDDLFDVTAEQPTPQVVVRLHVQPGAGRTAVVGRHGNALKVKVGAPPEGGRANDACLALMAETFNVPAAQVELVSGGSSRTKRVQVRGVAPDDVRRLLQLALERGNAGPSGGVRSGARSRP